MWTQEATAFAQDAWRQGRSATEIANQITERFGTKKTRNAVIGRMHRTMTEYHKPSRENERRTAPRPRRTSKAPVPRIPKCARYVDPPTPIEPLNVPFLENGPFQCKAITDATRFEQKCCGHPVVLGGVYCAPHAALHWQAGTTRERVR